MKYFLISTLIIISFFSCAKKSSTNFSIDVTIDNSLNGKQVFLKKQVDRKVVNLDTTVIQNGKFSFKGNIKEPIIFGIFIDSLKRGAIFPFIGKKDHINIVADIDSLHKSKITGSKLNDELTQLREAKQKLTNETKKYLPAYQKALQVKDTITLNNINEKLKIINNKMDLNDWKYVKANPKSFISPLVFSGIMTKKPFKDSIKIVFNNFSDEIKKADLSKPIRKYFEYLEKQKSKPKAINTNLVAPSPKKK